MKNDRTRASRKAARRYNVSPVARAVRSVLTVSAAALLFSGSGLVLAQSPVPAPVPAARASLSHEFAKVVDLTRVADEWTPKSVVDEGFQAFAAPMGIAEGTAFAAGAPVEGFGVVDDPTILPGSFHPGPGGVSGTDDAVFSSWDLSSYGGPVSWQLYDGFTPAPQVSTDGFAVGAFIRSDYDVVVHNYWDGTSVTGATWAAGVEVESNGFAGAVNHDTIAATATGADGVAFGVDANGNTGAGIYNQGTLDVNGAGLGADAFGMYAFSANGEAYTNNFADVDVRADGDAVGASAVSLGDDARNTNSGTMTVSGYFAQGLYSASAGGDATARNAVGALSVDGFYATGLYALSIDGDAHAINDASLDVHAAYGQGAWARSANGSAEAANTLGGSINVDGYFGAAGLIANADNGTATVTNGGTVNVISSAGVARGAFAYGDVVVVDNTGSITTGAALQAIGVDAEGDRSATVTNGGSLVAGSGGDAIGVWATSYGDTRVVNTASGNIDVDAVNGMAYGIYAGGEDAYVRNWATVDATSAYGMAVGIGVGGVHAFAENDGLVNATGGTRAFGMFGYGVESANLHNEGTINANATGTDGWAIGLFAIGDSAGANNNTGTITAVGATATGIDVRGTSAGSADNGNAVIVRGGDVSGMTVTATGESGTANVLNYGMVDAMGDNFALGMAAVARGYLGTASAYNGYGSTITASAKYGAAQGIVASADMDASVDNQGTLQTFGGDSAYGILALSADGDVTVDNAGMVVTSAQNRGYGIAYGIAAQSNNGLVSITNDGMLVSLGEYTAMGIYASTKWNDVEVTNNGQLGALAYTGAATGAIAISYTGAANVSNGEDGQVVARGAYSAAGLRAISLYGDANVTNDGSVQTQGGALDRGITARSLYGGTATITNTGDITTESGYSSYGVWARSDNGDSVVDNDGSIQSTSVYGAAYGALAGGAYTILVDNSGDIRAYAGDTAAGVLAYSLDGDASIVNSNYLLGVADNMAFGAQVIANNGTASLTNVAGGTIAASGYSVADAVFASGATVNVDNTGTLVADADGWAAGVEATGGDITVVSHTGGDISAYATSGRATGLFADADGDAMVRNGGNIDASTYAGDAFGEYASAGGNAVLTNGLTLRATSVQGDAFGMVGIGYNADLSQSGWITVEGNGTAVGIEGIGYAHANIVNNGDVTVTANSGIAAGLYTYSVHDTRQVNNGHLTVHATSGRAFGMYAYGFDDVEMISRAGRSIDASVDSGTAYGMFGYGARTILSNDGAIAATSGSGDAFGMLGIGYETSNVANLVHGTVDVNGAAAFGLVSQGDIVTATNAGDIAAHGIDVAVGMQGLGAYEGSTVSIDNTGALYAVVQNKYGNAAGIVGVADGDVSIANGGTIDVDNGRTAVGIQGHSNSGGVTVHNTGDIDAASTLFNGQGFGIDASTYGGDVLVDSTGSIVVEGKYATGINGYAEGGDVTINNGGSIAVETLGRQGVGILATSYEGAVAVCNTGTLAVTGTTPGAMAFGVVAGTEYGTASIQNGEGASVTATSEYGVAGGLYAYGAHVSIDNGGDVVVAGGMTAAGVAFDSYDATISNSGTITVEQLGTGTPPGPLPLEVMPGNAIGIAGYVGEGGTAHVTNDGTITVTALQNAYGIQVAGAGDVTVDGHGDIVVTADGRATGVAINAVHATFSGTNDITVTNTQDDDAFATAFGIFTTGESADIHTQGDITATVRDSASFGVLAQNDLSANVVNGGHIVSTSGRDAYGVRVSSEASSFDNTGAISASALVSAIGVLVQGDTSDFHNTGDITADSTDLSEGGAYGAIVSGGIVHFDNQGEISATAHTEAYGAIAFGVNSVAAVNGGSITAVGTNRSVGLVLETAGDASLVNTGLIGAANTGLAMALSVDVDGTTSIDNAGDIVAQAATEGSIAIRGGAGVELIDNSGRISGALLLGGGDDHLANAAGGTWTVRGHATDFGDGDDRIDNAGTIVLHDAAIHLGGHAGAGNAFNNTGLLSVQGDSLVDMGTGAAAPLSPINAPISVLNPMAFTNDGTISFLDGAPDDVLTVTGGDFAGHGALNVDVSMLHGQSDMLYIDGNVAPGAVQTLNVDILDLMTDATEIDIPVVVVQGDAAEGNLQAGSIIAGGVNFNANNFLDLKVAVNARRDAAGAINLFSLSLAFGGLNDTGALAASIAPGAHSLMNAQVGTFRQRMGAFSQLGDSDKGAWVRVFGDKGSITPEAHLDNLPVTTNFDFDQTNQGIEAGVNALITDGVYIGASLSKSRGKQDLSNGFGSDDIDGTTVGGYLTWLGQNGMYADVSYRWMHFDADLESFGGKREVGGDAGAFNAELGWNVWTSAGGMKLVPQVQYTRTKVENIDRIEGTLADFVSDGGTSSRARLGLEMEQTFQSASGTKWTPYGVVSLVREFDGETSFTVANAFTGRTSTEGTSGQLELGVNAKIGQRVDVWGGLNYIDGGAIDGVWGGQLGVRYTW